MRLSTCPLFLRCASPGPRLLLGATTLWSHFTCARGALETGKTTSQRNNQISSTTCSKSTLKVLGSRSILKYDISIEQWLQKSHAMEPFWNDHLWVFCNAVWTLTKCKKWILLSGPCSGAVCVFPGETEPDWIKDLISQYVCMGESRRKHVHLLWLLNNIVHVDKCIMLWIFYIVNVQYHYFYQYILGILRNTQN